MLLFPPCLRSKKKPGSNRSPVFLKRMYLCSQAGIAVWKIRSSVECFTGTLPFHSGFVSGKQSLCSTAAGCRPSFPHKGFGSAEQCTVNSNLPACGALIAVCVNIVAAERWLFDGFGAAPVFFCAMTLRFADAGRLQGYSSAIGADDGRGFRGQLSRAVFFLRHRVFSVFYYFLSCIVFLTVVIKRIRV